MASQSKPAAMQKGKAGPRWGALCLGAGAATLALPAARTAGFVAPARAAAPQAQPAAPVLGMAMEGAGVAGANLSLGAPAVLAASALAAAAGLAAGAASKKSRSARAGAQRAACPCDGVHGKKTQCIHPDKPMMFACADCPRRGGMAPQADLEGAIDMAGAAYIGEGANASAKKTQCIHPDKPMMFACADCPRRGGKAPEVDCSASAAAAYVSELSGEEQVHSAKKTQCIHPDKPMMFACADCPRRGGKTCAAPTADFDGQEVAIAVFVGEEACGCVAAAGKKSQCIHPDKPMMFACADCPRRGKAASPTQEEINGTQCAVAAFAGEDSGVLGKKTACLHPDKPMMFACADCPRRGKAPVPEADGAELAAAAFVGELAGKKTQCIHPDKPMMFACADCPRRGGKALVGSMDGEEVEADVAAAAYAGECGCAVTGKKTQCIHPDKPMMFACADCPRRGKAPSSPSADEDGEVSIAAFISEGCGKSPCVVSKKDQCLHPDKPMAFACGDCPRRG